jgi:damage-control phosphatase, subfamily II, stand-alone protein
MKPFVLLADPDNYNACSWDLVADREAGQYWIAFFIRHFDTILKLAELHAVHRGQTVDTVLRRIDACRAEFRAFFEKVLAEPEKHQTLTIIGMDRWRDGFLRKHGFVDPFEDLKNRENEKMLPLLPAACQRLDDLHGEDQIMAMVEGVFAGNIFDMGAEATAGRFLANSPDFASVIAGLPDRPWLVDDFDPLCRRLLEKPPKKTVFFIDNAGSDFLLGALPMIRWLAMCGEVVLVANERPTLNDMTIHDVNFWWPKIVAIEPIFGKLPIRRVSSGTGEPLIDLLEVSEELNAAAIGADLLILEGMGRGVESNFSAAFTCDTLNIAMVKDHMVAKRLAGKVYDVVCRFR